MTIWRFEGYGLVAITLLCFFPSLHHKQEYLFFALLIIGAAVCVWHPRLLCIRTPIDLPLILFLGWLLLSIPFAINPYYSFVEWRKLAAQVLVFYWAYIVLRRQESNSLDRQVLAASAVGLVIISTYALSDFIVRGGTWKDRLVRAAAPGSDYNWLSTYIVLASPALVALGWKMREAWKLIVVSAIGVAALAAHIASYTRAGWLAMAVQGVLFATLFRRKNLVIISAVCAIGLTIMVLAISSSGLQAQTISTNTFYYRVASWKLMLDEIVANPIVGIGYGTATFMFRFGDRPEAHDAAGSHNLFLMIAMGSGLPALGLFMWILWCAVREMFIGLAASLTTNQRVDAVAGIATVVGFAVRNVFDSLLVGSLGYLFWILLALAFSNLERVCQKKCT